MRSNRFTKTSKLLIFIALVSLYFFSCAYFNTLYNARKLYNKTEEERERGSSERALRDKYGEVVKKCANTIRDHPKSRWVDDALFLMGKALVRQGELNSATRKFVELTTNFPKSGYVPQAYYWLAFTYKEKKDFNLAMIYVDRFRDEFPRHDFRFRIMLLGGDIYRELDRDEEALSMYALVAEESGRKDYMETALIKSAELFYEDEEWEKAAANYSRALRKGLPWEKRYEISLALGDCFTRTGNCTEALKIFDGLLGETTSMKEKPPLMLGRAKSFSCMDSLDMALSTFDDVKKSFPRSKYSAEALYRMGMIYQEELDSLDRAQVLFSGVSGESADSEFAQASIQRSHSLKRLSELRVSSNEGESSEKSAEKRFLAAEIQLTRFDQIRMAIENYSAVVDSFPESDLAPKAAFALAWIYHKKLNEAGKAVEMYRSIISRFPRSPQARGAVYAIGELGTDELKARLEAVVDSALADTTDSVYEGAGEGVRRD